MNNLNSDALAKRKTLPGTNDFGIEQLTSMPELYDWIECSSRAGQKFHMYLGGRDDGVALRWFWNGAYEKATLGAWSWFSERAEGIIVDVGAHTGVYTLASLAARSRAVVVSFEPHFMNCARLNLNLRANKFATGNAFMLGVGEQNEVLPFSISTSLDYLSTGGSIGLRPNGLTTNIQVVALDSFFDESARGKVRLLKLDVEGYEGHCLRGMREMISRSRPVIFFECIDASAGAAVQAMLADYGYYFYEIDDRAGSVKQTALVKPVLDADGRPVMHRLNRMATTAGDLDENQFS